MATAPTWPAKAVRYLAPIILLLLVLEYLLGLWTSVYAPSSFTTSTSMASLMGHQGIGYLLGLFALLALIFTALTRYVPHLVLAVLLLIGVAGAGIAGRQYVATSPNPPVDSVVMGAMFLVAFVGAMGLTAMTWIPSRSTGPAPSAPAPS